jgi:hypothetical protein
MEDEHITRLTEFVYFLLKDSLTFSQIDGILCKLTTTEAERNSGVVIHYKENDIARYSRKVAARILGEV